MQKKKMSKSDARKLIRFAFEDKDAVKKIRECTTISRLQELALRENFIPREEDHLKECKYCGAMLQKISKGLWHPDDDLLRRFCTKATSKPEKKNIERHLTIDKCNKCSGRYLQIKSLIAVVVCRSTVVTLRKREEFRGGDSPTDETICEFKSEGMHGVVCSENGVLILYITATNNKIGRSLIRVGIRDRDNNEKWRGFVVLANVPGSGSSLYEVRMPLKEVVASTDTLVGDRIFELTPCDAAELPAADVDVLEACASRTSAARATYRKRWIRWISDSLKRKDLPASTRDGLHQMLSELGGRIGPSEPNASGS